jgi:hypothetical protein
MKGHSRITVTAPAAGEHEGTQFRNCALNLNQALKRLEMIKVFIGQDIAPGLGAEQYERWLRETHVPNCLDNPHLDRLVFNTVGRVIRGAETFYRIVELHFRDMGAFQRYDDWNSARPVSVERSSAGKAQVAFNVLTEAVDVDRGRLARMIADPQARQPASYPQPGAKAILGYDLMPGLTPETYDQWLWEVHAPDLLDNPHLERIVFNTVTRKLRGERSFFRISELHFSDLEGYAKFEQWRARNPVSAERSPIGRTAFKFYILSTVESVERS